MDWRGGGTNTVDLWELERRSADICALLLFSIDGLRLTVTEVKNNKTSVVKCRLTPSDWT